LELDSRYILLPILIASLALTALLAIFNITPALTGLSGVSGTAMFGSGSGASVIGSGLSTVAGAGYNQVIAFGQLAIGVSAVGLLFFYEVSDPRYGRTNRIVADLRESWIPLTALFLTILSITVVLKILGFS
jgi:hypothetical protein